MGRPKDVDADRDEGCGLGGCRPQWLQRCANDKMYMVAYGVLSLLQGMMWSYLIAVLSTIEKRFAMSSRLSGFSMTGSEYSNMIGALFVTYLGSRGHRPRWIGVGMYVCALSAFLLALPEFVLPGNAALVALYTNSSTRDVCRLDATAAASSSSSADVGGDSGGCSAEESDAEGMSSSVAATALIFFGMFVNGLGALPMYTLAWTYMDDSVPKRNLPAYLGITMGLRTIGPAFGYVLGGITLSIYHDPTATPEFGPDDPRWVGAWWLGFVLVGGAVLVASFPMLLFPRQLASHAPPPDKDADAAASKAKDDGSRAVVEDGLRQLGLPSLKEFPSALKAVLTNTLFMATVFEGVIYWLGLFGFIAFLPKYMEAQFAETASDASYITGLSTVLVMMLGFVLSGFVIQRLQPRARTLSAFSLTTGLLQVVLLLAAMAIRCEENVNLHGPLADDSTLILTSACNAHCGCTTSKLTPVCASGDPDRTSFFSACHMGCTRYNASDRLYEDCMCGVAAEPGLASANASGWAETATSGFCPKLCSTFVGYVVLLSIIRFVSSTERIGGTLIFLRSVKPHERNLALGVTNVFFCLISFLPCTVLYGALIDTTCLVWEESCAGGRGNCWVYDTDRFRYWLHGFSAALLFLSNGCQVYIWYKCGRLKLYDEVGLDDGPLTPDEGVARPAELETFLGKQSPPENQDAAT